MMDNAKWREDQRSKIVQKYREEEAREAKEAAAIREAATEGTFAREQLLKAAQSGSLEKRIQSNKHNIQRGNAAMAENFVRR